MFIPMASVSAEGLGAELKSNLKRELFEVVEAALEGKMSVSCKR